MECNNSPFPIKILFLIRLIPRIKKTELCFNFFLKKHVGCYLTTLLANQFISSWEYQV